MPIFNKPELAPWYAVVRQWSHTVLPEGDSLFTPGRSVWSQSNLDNLYQRFVADADEGEGDFLAKLDGQLADAPSSVRQLMAELLFVYYLPAHEFPSVAKKRQMVASVLKGTSPPVTLSTDLAQALELGIARPGQAYIQQRYHQLTFYLEAAKRLAHLDDSVRNETLADPWKLKALLSGIELYANEAARHMFLYMVHPGHFEAIISGKHRETIANTFANDEERAIVDEDRRLLAIRTRLTAERGCEIRYYDDSELKAQWQGPEETEESDEAETPSTEESVHYWKIAPGPAAKYWDACRQQGIIGIAYASELGVLSQMSKQEFEKKVQDKVDAGVWKNAVGPRQAYHFATRVKVDDVIIANDGTKRILGIGRVTGPYRFDPQASKLEHQMPVEWFDTTPRKLDVDLPHWRKTFLPIRPAEFSRITARPATADHCLPDEAAAPKDPLATLLMQRHNVALYGPPGTGKTHRTLGLASEWKRWQGPDSVTQVTFHPSYAYEDFIEGFRPDKEGKFTLKAGLFVQACDQAAADLNRKFLLIIDEINRGDVARVFGELITLIEHDKRDVRASRRLPYSQRELYVPPNLYLLGTMNTADRSISLLDVAIRRRFCFVECPPDEAVFNRSEQYHASIGGVELSVLLRALNARLRNAGVDRDRAVGHSHLLIRRDHDDSLSELRSRLRHDIIPLIEEYCYADRSRMSAILGDIVGSDGVIADPVFDHDDRLVDALKHLCSQVAI